MSYLSEVILPTPAFGLLKRRRNYGRFPPSRVTFIRDLQRLIKISTRARRVMSIHKLATKTHVDPHLLMRILENKGFPDTQKTMQILAFFKKRLAVVDEEIDN